MNKQEIENAIGIIRASAIEGDEIFAEALNTVLGHAEHQLTNGWIPVTEPPVCRRHESGEPVEFNILLRGATVATTGVINDSGVWGWMDWNDFDFHPIGVDVLYWQPLPKAPEEDKDAERN